MPHIWAESPEGFFVEGRKVLLVRGTRCRPEAVFPISLACELSDWGPLPERGRSQRPRASPLLLPEANARETRDEIGLMLSKADFVATLRHHRLVLVITGGLLLESRCLCCWWPPGQFTAW